MTPAAQVTVVVVSHGRADDLDRCLQSLRNQTCTNFEVVVVADALPDRFRHDVRYIPFAAENISTARNLGLAAAAGEIVAFCDDDAVPDPPWLDRLTAPFVDPRVGSSGGFTRGRNGISRQWGAARVDTAGEDHPFEIDETRPVHVFAPDAARPVKVVGTNMAFRKQALVAAGGFDESYRFYLEDADMKLRLDQAGRDTALVPAAQVHHLFAAGARRTRDRAPVDLFQIGASKAYFCKRHFGGDLAAELDRFARAQELRLLNFVSRGVLSRDRIAPLMRGLRDGMAEGQSRTPIWPKRTKAGRFLPFPVRTGGHTVLCARRRDADRVATTAREHLASGNRVSVIELSMSPAYFQVSFVNGYWLHRGGVWGRACRSDPVLRLGRFRRRFESEVARLTMLHDVDEVIYL